MKSHSRLSKYFVSLSLPVVLGSSFVSPVLAQTSPYTSIGSAVAFTCNDSEATIKAKNGPKVTVGTATIYIGYQQVSSTNKDPRLVRFDKGVRTWCRSDYETTGDDGTGYGLIWDGGYGLYGIFSSTGSQTGNDFRRFTTGRWLTSYGSGGGPKAAVIARINPINGDVNYATFLSARRPDNGNTNSLLVRGLSWNGSTLTVQADSWWTPRRSDRTSMSCTGSSPYKYTVVFPADLTKVNSASAIGCK